MRVTADTIRTAVESENASLCGKIAETLRFEYGMNYGKIWRTVSNVTGISMADWDQLLQESET